jgi:hydroxymethylpyrimidine pyrophosphatase-like HAD family hydrolase
MRDVRCMYVDLDGTLLGPGGSVLRGADGGYSGLGVRALEACSRAGIEVVIYSGRRQISVYEDARLLGMTAFIFELGCGLVMEGSLQWLTGGVEPSGSLGTIYAQIEASGGPSLLLERFAGALEYHTPWAIGREVSHLFRGNVSVREAGAALCEAGLSWLRLVDNGVVSEHSMPGSPPVHAYHLIPAAASKARAVARHMQARGYAASDCIAVGDSREDMDAAAVVGSFWFVANALERDPSLEALAMSTPGVRVATESFGAGVYEAVVTTLAERR